MTDSNRRTFLKAQWEKSLFRRFLHWLFTWRTLRKILFVAVGLITLTVLFYTIENWRGARAWQRYAARLEEQGEPVRFQEIVPPPVPDADNFAATAYWTNLSYRSPARSEPDTNRWPDLLGQAMSRRNVREPVRSRNSPKPLYEPMDFPALAEAVARIKAGNRTFDPVDLPSPTNAVARSNAALVIMREMAAYDSVLQEMRAAIDRPESRFPVFYDNPDPWSILLPHLSKVKGACVILQLKAKAELALDRPDRAFEDVRLMLKLTDAVRSEPILISYLVRLACLQITSSVVWEGQVWHVWEESHLRRLQDWFADYDVLDEMQQALRGERVFANAFFDLLIHKKRQKAFLREVESVSGDSLFETLFLDWAPRGWLYLEKLHYNQYLDEMFPPLEPPWRGEAILDPSLIEERFEKVTDAIQDGNPASRLLAHRLFASLLLPALDKVFKRAAERQAAADMTAQACALERYRLQHGSYPDNLSALVPDYLADLPQDVVTGDPYRYERQSGGRFLLYSVGWNETDDGGADSTKDETKDWVWRFP